MISYPWMILSVYSPTLCFACFKLFQKHNTGPNKNKQIKRLCDKISLSKFNYVTSSFSLSNVLLFLSVINEKDLYMKKLNKTNIPLIHNVLNGINSQIVITFIYDS